VELTISKMQETCVPGWDAGVNAGEVAWLGEDGGRGNPPSKENDTQPAGGAQRENGGGERLLGWVRLRTCRTPVTGGEGPGI